MGAIEYTPGSHTDSDREFRWSMAAIIFFIVFMIGLFTWAIITPRPANPHAGQVCIRETDRLLPYTSTDMWGHTTTQLRNQTQCLEWQRVEHQ